MAILVDELREYPDVALPFTVWCHMATDGDFEELHAFAARLGLRRAWFQRDHYDLPAHGRAAAIALGAEEVGARELLARMAGPRGERARRRALTPDGVMWLVGAWGPATLRYPAGALVVIDGPSALAHCVAEGVPVLDAWREELPATLRVGAGAVVVTRALRHADRLELAGAAAAAGVEAHLVLLDAGDVEAPADGAGPEPFASATVLDPEAAERLRRIVISPSS